MSGVACPRCAVGLHSLGKALQNVGSDIAVEFHLQPSSDRGYRSYRLRLDPHATACQSCRASNVLQSFTLPLA